MWSGPTLGRNKQRQLAGSRLVHLGLVAVVLACSMPTVAQEKPLPIREKETRPNVLVVLMDDLGWRDLGCYGGRFIDTPAADRLAREGMRFTDAYAAAPVCSPTRASLLTGQYPGRIGMYEVIQLRDRPYAKLTSPPLERELPESLETVAEIVSGQGYVCGSIGKWHVGRTPVEEGFIPIAEKLDDPELAALPEHSPQKQIGKYTAQALRLLRDHRDRPFLLFLNHHAVHAPLEARPELIAKYQAKAARTGVSDIHPAYAAMTEMGDESLEQVLAELERLGQVENTVVIFTSDNGGLIEDLHLKQPTPLATSNRPLRSQKGDLYEGGIRIPLIVRWPGSVASGSVCRVPVTSPDLFATILDLAGTQAPVDQTVDGVSLVPLLLQTGTIQREALFWHFPTSMWSRWPGGAIRKGDFKLIEFFEDDRVELYDLANDLGETSDLAAERPNLVSELRGDLHRWRQSINARMPVPNPDFDPERAGLLPDPPMIPPHLIRRSMGQDQNSFDFPNHHMHTFQVSENTYEHAVAMGYRLVVYSGSHWAGKPEYKHLGKIMNHNSDVSPLRIHARKSDGKLFVSYFARTGVTADHLNAVALQNGVRRVCEKQTEMDADDLRLLKGFGAARLPVDDLTLENATYAEIKKRFHTSWPLENSTFESCNVRCNWQSRKVVEDMTKSALENIPWAQYDVLFFDTLCGNVASAVNGEFGGLGSYPSLPDGKLAFVNAVVEFVRNPSNTGRPRPYPVFANIWNPMLKGSQFQSWYGTGKLRMDHYYFEQGCQVGDKARYLYELGTQRANGVVPGGSQPAYVPLDKSGNRDHAEAYLPANLVAVDDAYTWSRLRSRLPDFDHAAFFDQHLDACGTAGIQGSWFGWYGEDYIDIKDREGRLIYSNACQLLRAIPNWDNLRHIPVPPFDNYSATDEREWNGKIYRSTHSHASNDVVYSRNPDNEELYVVFRGETGVVHLLPGETPVSARFVNPWFTKTEEDAFPSLKISPQEGTIKLMNTDQLGRGVRVTTTRERP